MQQKIYAEYAKDLKDIRLRSSSGGAFNRLANAVLNEGGIVFGVVYDKNTKSAQYSNTDDSALEDLMRSKYLSVKMNDTFKRVIDELTKGRLVLFSGSPCTIAGLKKLIEIKYTKYIDNIILVDFLCEGVPSNDVFKMYINDLERKYKSKSKDVIFRSKSFGWKSHCMKIVFESGKEYVEPYIKDTYINAFIELLFNRPSCYDCQYRDTKVSDITLSDFWKVGKVLPDLGQNKFGVSAVFANTKKGDIWINKQKDVRLIELEEQDFEYARQKVDTIGAINKRNLFMNEFIENGYMSAIKKYSKIGRKKTLIEELKTYKHYLKLLKIKQEMRHISNGK